MSIARRAPTPAVPIPTPTTVPVGTPFGRAGMIVVVQTLRVGVVVDDEFNPVNEQVEESVLEELGTVKIGKE
jgi:hypothetical protein